MKNLPAIIYYHAHISNADAVGLLIVFSAIWLMSFPISWAIDRSRGERWEIGFLLGFSSIGMIGMYAMAVAVIVAHYIGKIIL